MGRSKLHTAVDSFDESRDILDRKPNIKFFEPEQVYENTATEEPVNTIEVAKKETDALIDEYGDIKLLSEEAQLLIDDLAKDLVIKLDPDQDAHVIDAIQRHTGVSSNEITYAMYKECLDHINQASSANIDIPTKDEITNAGNDQFRTSFGGLNLASGLKRPELDRTNQSIKPINMKKFKTNMVKKLFLEMKGMISKLITDLVLGKLIAKIAKKILF